MRLIRGETLAHALERFHADDSLQRDPGTWGLELRKLLRRFIDVCNAMEYAHGRGILHRDLKPSNVMLGKHGETLVVDWGLAKPIGSIDAEGDEEGPLLPASAPCATLPGSAVGTPSYMSPEQAAGRNGQIGPRSDVYSLGATFYSLLPGELARPSAARGDLPEGNGARSQGPLRIAPRTGRRHRPLESR
jgi:serine/threonine protein kinase